MNFWMTYTVTGFYIPFGRVSLMQVKVVNLHLVAYLSLVSDPAYADPGGGYEGLVEGIAQDYLVLLVAYSQRVHCPQDRDVPACEDGSDGEVSVEP